MKEDLWDREYESLLRDAGQLLSSPSFQPPSSSQSAKTVALKSKLIQLDLKLDHLMREIKLLAERSMVLSLQRQNIQKGISLFLEKVKSLQKVRGKLFTKSLWLLLLKGRLSHEHQGAGDYVDLSLRQRQIKKTMDDLNGALAELNEEEKRLRLRYELLQVARTNQEAFQAFNLDFHQSGSWKMHPILQGLKEWLGVIPHSLYFSEPPVLESLKDFDESVEATVSLCARLAHDSDILDKPWSDHDTQTLHDFIEKSRHRENQVLLKLRDLKVKGFSSPKTPVFIPEDRP